MLTIRTPATREAFLIALADLGSVTAACERAGMSRNAAYVWRSEDEDFAAKWQSALDLGTDALEDEAVRRGHLGDLRPVFQGGVQVGVEREFSDRLLIFMLKVRRPNRYCERFTVNVNITSDLAGHIETSRKRTIEG
ncbi:hypothetical protein MMC19_007785 [Ptychographa xylographoides]|nr:hypothetical protein [Ptychographa xylographoides]